MQIIIRESTHYALSVKQIIEHLLQIDPHLYDNIKYIYLEHHYPHRKQNGYTDKYESGYYIRDKNYENHIILNLNHFLFKSILLKLPLFIRYILKYIFAFLLVAIITIFSPILLLLILYQIIKDNNIRIDYLIRANRIPHKFKKYIKDKNKLHIYSHLFYFLGLCKAMESRKQSKKYSISDYEIAYKNQIKYLLLVSKNV